MATDSSARGANVLAIVALLAANLATCASASDVPVKNAAELRAAIAEAKPGTRIVVASGTYGGGFSFNELRGEASKPIIIAAADETQPPIFSGAVVGLHLSCPAFVELHHLTFTGLSGNGLNIDDGASPDGRAHHVVLRGLKVSDIGPGGNRDGIKLSGLDDFRIEGCTIERWGSGGGSAIDMVGCHRGAVEGNLFRHPDARGSSGVQCKGGSSRIVIRRNRFENAGGRAVNIGGSTGLQYFRPPLVKGAEHSEAREIRVEGNTFIGSMAPIVFAGADGAVVRFNTIYRPNRWALRILQENDADGFVPCRNGEFTDNLVVFDSREWSEGGVNVGDHTAPKTFKFARNWWYCADRPERSRPRLPVEETDGIYGDVPRFRDAEKGDLRLHAESATRGIGAQALRD